MPVLLLFLLSWLPVTTNCDGSPTNDVHHYEVRWGERACVGWDTDTPTCIEAHEVRIIYWTTTTRLPAADPPALGAGYWYEVVAVDGAGNKSDQCPP